MGQNSTLSRFRVSRIPQVAALLIYFCLLGAATQAQVTVSVTSTNVSCFGGSNGTATATGGGGWSPYTYHWSTGATTASITGLPAGTYYVTATDVDQGYAVGTVIITQPPQLGVQVYGESQICGIVPDGKVTAVPYGGTQPYTYHWSNGGTTAQITGLPEGTYTVTVTDANGCTTSGSGTVYFWNEGIWLMDTSTNVTCFGLNNGTASIMGMSGTPPYTYHWSTGANTPSVSGLAPGNYTVTVTDANGCSNFTNILITQPPVLGCTSTTVNAACGLAGSATVIPSGGTPPYTIVWNTGSTSFTITGMPGTYTATLTDANGCTKPVTVTIGGTNTSLTVTATVISNAGCTVGGKAMASATGGSGNYAFSWDNGQNTAMASNLSAGNHSVTVTDITTGCTGVGTVNIPTAPTLTATAVVVTNATCLLGGSATASGSGGTPPYTFKWDNNQTTATATNLGAGPHSVTVTDAAGCVATAIVIIGQTQGPTVTAVVNNNASCTAGGKATATATGGAGGYIFLWDTGANTQNITNLSAGTYTVTVTDALGCTSTGQVSVAAAIPPNVVIVASSNARCDQPGSATASASGGATPYSYHWDNNENTAVATNLTAGTHTVTVTDAAGCTATATVTIGTTANGITIGDFVWYDDTQDGFQNNIELDGGVPGVTVMLIKAGTDGNFGTSDDVIVATTTTDNDGIYHFTCVTPGTYVIMFSGIPAGYVFSPKDNTSNDCNDSDAGANGKTSPFTIIAGQPDNLCFDAGIHIPCANVTYAGFICCDQIICEGQTPSVIYQVNPPSGGSGAFEYQWMQLVLVNGLPAWQPIPGATSATYQPGALFETSRYMRCARRAGCNNFLESNIIVITVQPAGGSNCPDFTSDIHALVQPNNTVGIDWATGAEGDAYIYTVQRSTNRITWDVVTTVMGQHNTTGPNTYTAVDQTPLAGTSYYRIKRSNANGINAFSQSVEVRLDLSAVTAVTVNPNPVTDKLLIKNVMSYDSDVIVTISTTQGDIIHTLTIPKGSVIQEEVTMSNLPSGIYMVRIKLGNGEVKTVKIAKI